MPHQCVRCGEMYPDADKALLSGCGKCGKKVFFFIRKERLEQMKETPADSMTEKDKQELEKDVYDILGENVNKAEPVVLDLESIRVLKPGKYEVDLVNLFDKKPVIFQLSEGKYMIDLPTSFKQAMDK